MVIVIAAGRGARVRRRPLRQNMMVTAWGRGQSAPAPRPARGRRRAAACIPDGCATSTGVIGFGYVDPARSRAPKSARARASRWRSRPPASAVASAASSVAGVELAHRRPRGVAHDDLVTRVKLEGRLRAALGRRHARAARGGAQPGGLVAGQVAIPSRARRAVIIGTWQSAPTGGWARRPEVPRDAHEMEGLETRPAEEWCTRS